MQKILIFGGTGSGKTTLANKMSKKMKIPAFCTDQIVWRHWDTDSRTEKEIEKKVFDLLKNKKWILEGVHARDWLFPVVKDAEMVIILHLSPIILCKRVFSRQIGKMIKKGIKGLAWAEFRGLFKLIYFSLIYKNGNYVTHRKMVKKYKKRFIILRSQREVDVFLCSLG